MSVLTTDRSRSTRVLTLAVCVAGAVLPASLTGSSAAIPHVAAEFGSGVVATQWVVNAYNLAFAGVMLAAGGFADRWGRRRVFAVGLLVFVLSSVGSALAPGIVVLDVCRALAGVGAAGVLTAGTATLAAVCSGPRLTKAFAVFGASLGAGLALGPVASGAVVEAAGWRWVFAVHAVICGAVLLVVPRFPVGRDASGTAVDWWGAGTFTAGLLALTLALVEAPHQGWTSPAVLGLAALVVVALGAFVVVERRTEAPLFDLALFRRPRFLAVCAMPVVLAFGFVSVLVLLPSYFAGTTSLSSAGIGLLVMALTLPVMLVPLATSVLTATFSTRTLLAGSLVVLAVGALVLLALTPTSHPVVLAVPLLLVGTGMGLTAGVLDGAAVSAVETARAGSAAGMFNTLRLAGETVAVVVTSVLVVSGTRSALGARIGTDAGGLDGPADHLVLGDLPAARAALGGARDGVLASSFTSGLHLALVVVAALCVLGALVVAVLLRTPVGTPDGSDGASLDVTPAVDDAALAGRAS